jgi:methyl-accepting chemotaxis protein
LQIRRFQNDSLGYLDYISRYPYLAEVQLAIDSLYLLEATKTLNAQNENDAPSRPTEPADEAAISVYNAAIKAFREEILKVNPSVPQSWSWREDLSACDEFLRSYPAAAQWSTVSAYATSLSINIEGALFDDILVDASARVERSRILLGNAVNLYQRLRRLRRPVPPTGSVDDDQYVIQAYIDVGRARFLLEQINRIEQVLGAHYRNSDAYRELFELQLRWETNDNIRRVSRQLSSIQSTLETSHRQLITELRVQFDQTRLEVRKGFSEVSTQLDALRENLDRNFAAVVGGLNTLHEDMIVANTRLAEVVNNTRDANRSLNAINNQLARTNEKLDEVVSGQARIKDSVDQLDRHVSNGLEDIKNEIKAIGPEGPTVTFGFGFPFLGPTVNVDGGGVVDICNDVCDAAADVFGW